MPQLLIATKNAHKTEEFRALLGPAWEVSDLNAHPEIPAPEETGATFAENALLKARAAAQHFAGTLVLADDSGLEVDTLGGAPGVFSARYAGPTATDADNRARLLRELSGLPQPWTARFRCVLALSTGETFAGAVEGHITSAERGHGGFGYDSLFVPEGQDQTFAELPASAKNQLSHRARALAAASAFLQTLAG